MACMEDVLDLYAEPYDPKRPMVCFDETSKQLLAEKRSPIPAKPGRRERYDYEYQRQGTRNLFMLCEPRAGWRHVAVTERRTMGRSYAIDYDATPWLEFFIQALSVEVLLLVDRITDWHRAMEGFYKAVQAKGWDRRNAEGLAFARWTGQITRSDYMEISGVSPATASRDLAMLTRAGVLIKEGKTRSSVYRPRDLNTPTAETAPLEQLHLQGNRV